MEFNPFHDRLLLSVGSDNSIILRDIYDQSSTILEDPQSLPDTPFPEYRIPPFCDTIWLDIKRLGITS